MTSDLSAIVLPAASPLRTRLERTVRERRCVFVAGLPGVGKTLLVQQIVLLAVAEGRKVATLQWDVARRPYDREDLLERFPETDGVTHPVLRRAAGLWLRPAIATWSTANPASRALLVAETPLIGGRFVDVAVVHDDACETLLAGDRSEFFVPVPTTSVRRDIEAARARDMRTPADARETTNAPSHLLVQAMRDLESVARALILPEASRRSRGYDPDLYRAVYLHALRHRRATALEIADVFPVMTSAYRVDVEREEIVPSAADVDRTVERAAAMNDRDLQHIIEHWYLT
jgi:hypothetical protein